MRNLLLSSSNMAAMTSHANDLQELMQVVGKLRMIRNKAIESLRLSGYGSINLLFFCIIIFLSKYIICKTDLSFPQLTQFICLEIGKDGNFRYKKHCE